MADVKITDLQQISSLTNSVSFPVDNGIQTYRATMSQVKTYLTPIYIPPSLQVLSGSGTYNRHYAFIASGVNATVGATYTNNGVTFTVVRTVSASNYVVLSGNNVPTSSGTLTKASGTGDTSITFTEYRLPVAIKVKMAGGGGGGGAGGGSGGSPGNGADGSASTFGTSLLTAGPGLKGGPGIGAGGAGGSNTINSPAISLVNVAGGAGSPGNIGLTNGYAPGGNGGANALGGAGAGAAYTLTGLAGVATTGAGGGGGNSGAGSGAGTLSGGGGGAGGYLEAIIYDPAATYSYATGGGGVGGTPAGTGATTGGAGATGTIIVEAIYQ